MPLVRIPDKGLVRFPDDMTPEQIQAAIRIDIMGEKELRAPEPTILDRVKGLLPGGGTDEIPGYPAGFFERRIIPEAAPETPEKREQYWAMPPKKEKAAEAVPGLKAPESRLTEELKKQADLYAKSGLESRAGTMYMMAGLGRLIEESGGGNFGTWLKQIYQKEAESNTEMADSLRRDPANTLEAINQKIVQGALGLLDPQLALMPLPAGYGAARALTQYGMGEPLPASLVKGMESALIAKGFGLSHGMKPIEAGAKVGALGATEAAARTAAAGGTPKEAALAGLEGGTTTGLFAATGAAKIGPAARKVYEQLSPSIGHEKALEIARTVEAEIMKTSPKMPEIEKGDTTVPFTPEKPGAAQAGKTVGGAGGVIEPEKVAAFAQPGKPDIIPPVTSKKGPGEKPTEATPKPEGGIAEYNRRTYESALEEYVAKGSYQGDFWFHGSDKPALNFKKEKGRYHGVIFLTKNLSVADQYSGRNPENVQSYRIKQDANMLNLGKSSDVDKIVDFLMKDKKFLDEKSEEIEYFGEESYREKLYDLFRDQDLVEHTDFESKAMQRVARKLGYDGILSRQEAVILNPAESIESTYEATPIRVQRIEEPGIEISFDKPHGLYTTPEGVESPHADLGGKKTIFEISPKANVLDIPEYESDIVMRKGAVSAGAGVHAARHLLGDDQFKILKGKPKQELIAWASKRYPFADFSKYYDAQEVMEAIGGLEARKAGYDVFRVEDKKQPEFSETVILNKDIAREINQSRPSGKGGSAAKPDISPIDAETKKFLPRQTRPIITIEQKKRIAKKKAIKEQQLQIESAEDAKKAVHSMIRERRNRLNLASYETNLFVNEIERTASRQQREVIPFIIEGTDIPKGLNRPDLEKIHSKDKSSLKPIAQQVKKHFDEGWQKMKEHAPEMSAQQIEDYVTHIWDIPKGQKRMVSNWFTTQNRFLKKRFIETINEGVEKFGLQPKTLDIAEIIRIHDSIMNRVIENNRFVEDLKTLKKDGVPLIERADKAPQNWVYFDHPALRRGLVIPGEAKMGEKVSPELADLLTEMGVAIGRRISPKAFGKPVSKMGEYRPGETPEVRFQRFMSNRTVAHEIGHHIDEVLKLGDSFLDKYKTELYAINKDRIESFPDPKKKAYAASTEEQIAEFFATLFTKPDKAKKLAPTATVDALERLKKDGILSKLVDFDFEKNAKNLIEEQLNTMVKLPVKVHPDLEKPLKVIFDSRIDHPALQAYETANGILKKTKLSISLFHHMALGETAVSIMGLRRTAGIYFDPVKIYKAMVQGKYDVYQKEPIARDAIGHGLQVGATSDIPVNMIQTKLNDLARKSKSIPVARELTAFLRTFNETWDKALWNYLHDTLKLYAYEHLASKIDPTKDIKLQKQEIAQFVNDTFGGQNWDTLMVSPKSLQLMSWSLLSPDWTLSTLRQALAPTGIGKLHKETAGLRKKMGKHFWIKAALYFGVGINMLNYTYRKKDEEEHPEYYQGQERSFMDRTMAGNTIGHKTHLFVGRYDDGTERYVRWGKQFRELPEMFFDDTGFCPLSASLKKIGGKLSPVIQHTFDTFTGVSPSGFRNEDIYGKAGWDRVAGIAKSIMKAPLPFSSRSLFQEGKEFHLTDVAMPSSKGMTRYRSMELFKLAITRDDERMLKEVYQETLRNNLPAYTLFGSALASLKAESTKEYNEGLKTVADIQERLRNVTSVADAARLKRSLQRIQKENVDRKAGLKLLNVALANIEKYKLEERPVTKKEQK